MSGRAQLPSRPFPPIQAHVSALESGQIPATPAGRGSGEGREPRRGRQWRAEFGRRLVTPEGEDRRERNNERIRKRDLALMIYSRLAMCPRGKYLYLVYRLINK